MRGRRTIFVPLQDPCNGVGTSRHLDLAQRLAGIRRALGTDDRACVKQHPVDRSAMTRPLLVSLADAPRFVVTDATIPDPFDSCDRVATINSGVGVETLTRAGRDAEFPDERWRRCVVVLPNFRQEVLDPADSDAVARRATRDCAVPAGLMTMPLPAPWRKTTRGIRRSPALRSLAAATLACAVSQATAASPLKHDYLELAMSPDGRFVAAVEGDAPPTGGEPIVRQLVIRSTDGKSEVAVPLPCGAVPQCWPGSPAWTPDGTHLAFALRAPGSHARAVFQVRADGSGLTRLLAFDGTIQTLRYAKTGALAMLATAHATKEIGATEAGAPVTGDLDATPPSQRLAVLEPGKKALRWVSRDGLFVYEYDWLPDARGFVGTAAPGDGDRNWWVAKLFAFDVDGAPERVIHAPASAREQLAAPTVAPDGRHVAFIAGLMSDFGATGGDVLSVPVAGGIATNLTPGAASSVTELDWACNGHLRATVLAGDQMQRVDLGDGTAPAAARVTWSAPVNLDLVSTGQGCASGLETGTIQTDTAAPEIHLRNGHDWKPLTHRNAALASPIEVHSVHWQNEGRTLQGWLLLPPASARPASSRMPMIVWIHGGPAGASQPTFAGPGLERSLLDRGYAIFRPNPRGSLGQGDAFTQANVKDFGGGDLRDILSGVDAVVASWPIDGDRLGITGHSYGGFMTMWAVTQTNRFKAAVAGAGLANWQSYYGENDIVEWMTPYFGASVYADPAIYAKSSPINFITRVKTPVFSYVGEADIECPAAQTQEFGRALRVLGVPSSTVIYPGEGHAIRDPAALADIERRTLAWFDRYLAKAPS